MEQECRLRNGQVLVIRPARREDAARISEYINQIGGESDFLTFGKGGFAVSDEREGDFIEELAGSDHELMLCAWIGDELAGHLVVTGSEKSRIRHVGEMGITVRKKYWGIRVGSELLKYLLKWAEASHVIRKINLRVRSDNERAIRLYQKAGFAEEGRISREILIDGIFYSCIQMGILID